MNKNFWREFKRMYQQLAEIYEQMEEADKEKTEHLMELATAIEYQIIDLKGELYL